MSSKPVNPKKIKKMICTQGSKGGVGKTFVAAQIVSWLKAKGIAFKALDLDTENKENGGLAYFIPEAQKVDIHTLASLDFLLDASQEEVDVFIIDMPAATGYLLFEWFAEMRTTCKRLGLEFVFVCMITSDSSTVTNTLAWVDSLQGNVAWVIAKNPMENAHGTFPFWDDAEEVDEFKEIYKPSVIDLPSIRSDIMPFLGESGLTLHEAAEDPKKLPPQLNKFAVQERIRTWRDRFFEQLEKIQRILLP